MREKREKKPLKPLKKAHQLQREKISRFSATLAVLFTVGKNYFRLAVMRQFIPNFSSASEKERMEIPKIGNGKKRG